LKINIQEAETFVTSFTLQCWAVMLFIYLFIYLFIIRRYTQQ